MTEFLSDADLDRLDKLAAEATPGPWVADVNEVSQAWSRPEPWLPVVSTEVACMAYCYGGSARGIESDEDAEFIAASRTALPALLAEVREHRARVAADERDRAALGTTPESVTDAGGPVLAGVDAGCRCIQHEQYAGCGYTEYLLEYEPACPEHSEHLYDPRSGGWVLRERSVTDEMVEAGARAAYDKAFMKHAPEYVDRWDNLVVDNGPAAESWRDVARAVLSAVLWSRDADAPGDGSIRTEVAPNECVRSHVR